MPKAVSQAAFRQAEHEIMRWTLTVEPGVVVEDTLASEFWVHVAKDMKPRHEVVVWAHDLSWRADLVVIDAGPLWAKVKILQRWDFEKILAAYSVPVPETADYEIKHRASRKWCVMRLSDNKPVIEDLASKDDAALWLTNHLQKIAA